jgi:hypothetical protein
LLGATALDLNSVAVPVQDSQPISDSGDGALWYDSDDNTATEVAVTDLLTTGTADDTTFLRGDGAWTPVSTDPAPTLAAAYKGDYDYTSTYAKGDIVTDGGKSYLATTAVAAGPLPSLVYKNVAARTTGAASLTVPNDGSVSVGDLMLVVISHSSSSTTPAITGGAGTTWTLLSTTSSASTYMTYGWVYCRTVQAADLGAALTFDTYSSYGGVDFRIYTDVGGSALTVNAIANASTSSTPGWSAPGKGVIVSTWTSMTNTSAPQTLTLPTSGVSNPQSASASSYFVIGSVDEPYSGGSTTSRTATCTATGGFIAFETWIEAMSGSPVELSLGGTWVLLPWAGAPDGESDTWELIERVSPLGATTNTVGNLRFDNIPTKYRRLRLRSTYISHSSTSTDSLAMRFNNDAGANYGQHMLYASTGSLTGTTAASQAYAFAMYNYFYGGAARKTHLDVEIDNSGVSVAMFRAESATVMGAASYSYTSQVDGHWNSTDKITQIDLFTPSLAATWDSASVVSLYGQVDD